MKTFAVPALVAGLLLVGAPIALAQDDDRECNQAQREVSRVELRLATIIQEERAAEVAVRDAAQAAFDAAVIALRDATDANRAELQAARDAAQNALQAAKDALNTDSRRLANLRVELTRAVEARDKACAPEPTPTPTPTPTTTPAPTTTPPPAFVDLDCDQVSDERAQELLDADPSDPHRFDEDNDGVACELGDPASDRRTVVVVPNGGIATGGGPA